ncbi:hypothetical protein AaE_005575 [Aphanomyces astaci]|uniref:Gfo/Idh/MocA-like oxidoreductase N-terminal domain-containing protein n=1 Tax=Aphanomyces astaci TaxID=112090 RepID=A0A6A5AM99_APHAT|nr:hypothetical protein AaE_005575 [Aphanomyces astaci]
MSSQNMSVEERGPVRAIIIGAGQRGRTYAQYALEHPDLFKIVGVAEPREYWRNYVASTCVVLLNSLSIHHAQQYVFDDWTAAAAVGKFADCVIIATQDALHADPAVVFADLGYHILLEKPMAVTKPDCLRIHAAVKRNNVMLSVCHVMRCSPYSLKLRELTRQLGTVVNIQHMEPVGFWHQVHSYVRGNWRREADATFMLMAKSCHDIDYLHFLMEKPPRAVSSFGSLDQKPVGASTRCLGCAVEAECVYSAKKIYLDVPPIQVSQPVVEIEEESQHGQHDPVGRKSLVPWYNGDRSAAAGYQGWPLSVLDGTQWSLDEPTVESITEALRTGPYGRCVYACDNDVVDNQVVNFQFVDGATASFTMVAFTEATCVRTTKVFGTKGELTADGYSIRHFDFLSRLVTEHIPSTLSSSKSKMTGHGGADYFLIENFVHGVRTNDPSVLLTGADESLQSHLMVFAAEEARVADAVVHF